MLSREYSPSAPCDYFQPNAHRRSIRFTAIIAIVATLLLPGFLTHKAYAAPTPDTCFAYSPDTPSPGEATITDYYDHENNDSNQPACTREPEVPSTLGGDTVTVIGDHSMDEIQLTAVTLPSTITTIDDYAFADNEIETISIPSSVTTIEADAFRRNSITNITIPNNVDTIGNDAFSDNQIASVTVDGTLSSAGIRIFNDNPTTTFTYNGTTHTASDPVTEHCYEFDSGTGTITGFLFADITTIDAHNTACLNKTLTIPSTISGTPVTTIGEEAIESSGLTDVTIPDSVTTIEGEAFGRNNISNLVLGNNVATLGIGAFLLNELTSVTLPASLTTIGSEAFIGNQIVSVNVPANVTSLGQMAFAVQTFPGGTSYYDVYRSGLVDPVVNQDFINSVVYTHIYIDPTQADTLGLTSSYATEATTFGHDINEDGDTTDVISAQLINPSYVTHEYEDETGNTIAATTTATGTGPTDYLAAHNTTNDLNLYYFEGDSYDAPVAPTINDYTLTTQPNDISLLEPGDNTLTYIYQQDAGNGGGSYVESVLTAPTNTPAVLRTPTGTTHTCSTTVAESSLVQQDTYNYPLGLIDFCFTTGQTDNEVTLIFVTELTPNQVTPRKYNTTTNTTTRPETKVDGKTITKQKPDPFITIGNHSVTGLEFLIYLITATTILTLGTTITITNRKKHHTP